MGQKNNTELTTAKEISQIYKTPFDVTARVLQIMAGKGILKSEQGVHGGYLLKRNFDTVSFLELAEAILGKLNMVDCLYDEDDCKCQMHDSCNITTPLSRLNEKTKDFYRSLMLQELIGSDVTNVQDSSIQYLAV